MGLNCVWAGELTNTEALDTVLEPFYSLLFIDLPTLLPNLVGHTISLPIKLPHQIELFYILLHIIKIPDIFTRSLVGYVPTRVYSIMLNVNIAG
jgi:hypothetical protein